MTQNSLNIGDIIPLILTVSAFVIGYFVFRNDQKNTNSSVEEKLELLDNDMSLKVNALRADVSERFSNVKIDISKNDKRIRNDFQSQNYRNDKSFVKIENELGRIHERQIKDGHDMVETKTTLRHLTTSMSDVSVKLDLVIEKLMGGGNEKSKG